MLSEISWGSYIAGVAILLLCYYAGVALTCYRKEILALLMRKKENAAGQGQPEEPVVSEHERNADFDELELFVSKIDSILLQAGTGADKPQLLTQLKEAMANYGGLRRPALKVAVFNHIISKAEEICGARISAQELER